MNRQVGNLIVLAALVAIVWGLSRNVRAANSSAAASSSGSPADTAALSAVASGPPAGAPQDGIDWELFQPRGPDSTGVGTDLENGLAITGLVPSGF